MLSRFIWSISPSSLKYSFSSSHNCLVNTNSGHLPVWLGTHWLFFVVIPYRAAWEIVFWGTGESWPRTKVKISVAICRLIGRSSDGHNTFKHSRTATTRRSVALNLPSRNTDKGTDSWLVRIHIVPNHWLPARIPDRGIDAARRRLEVTKEAGTPALFPVWRIVRIDTGARMQHTEKRMLIGIDHDPGMSAPDGQVTHLRTCDSSKVTRPFIKVGRARVLIRETGALVEFVDKMRAIGREICMMVARIQRGA